MKNGRDIGPRDASDFRAYLHSYALAEGVRPLRSIPLRRCKRLSAHVGDPVTDLGVALDRAAVGRALGGYARGQWTIRELDDWSHFIQWGFHPSQFQVATDKKPPVKEGEAPLSLMARVKVHLLLGDQAARDALENFLADVCCIIEDIPSGQSEAPLLEAARSWLERFGQGQAPE